jgi:predicted nucleic acid-binding protein
MILVDTSVWIEHLRAGQAELAALLNEGVVLTHPFVIGELACGSLRHRARILADLAALPAAVTATDAEVLRFVEEHKLHGLGIGWIDAHLLASALITNCRFWTLDRRLERSALAARVKPYRSR